MVEHSGSDALESDRAGVSLPTFESPIWIEVTGLQAGPATCTEQEFQMKSLKNAVYGHLDPSSDLVSRSMIRAVRLQRASS